MTEPAISLRDFRRAAVKFDGARLTRDEAFAFAEAVEALHEVHERLCGCDNPGDQQCCRTPSLYSPLARFSDFGTEAGT